MDNEKNIFKQKQKLYTIDIAQNEIVCILGSMSDENIESVKHMCRILDHDKIAYFTPSFAVDRERYESSRNEKDGYYKDIVEAFNHKMELSRILIVCVKDDGTIGEDTMNDIKRMRNQKMKDGILYTHIPKGQICDFELVNFNNTMNLYMEK